MNQKVIVVVTTNFTPEGEVEDRLLELGSDWKVVSASTSIAALGEPPYCQVFYATTVVVEGVEKTN